jgi:hypothetical protein
MAYSNFTLAKLKKDYGIKQVDAHLFIGIDLHIFQASQHLLDDIEQGKDMPLYTEKAKSESLISPIIREMKRKNPHITIFSGYSLNIENDEQLNGNPDFMISAKPNVIEPQNPIFCLFESKNKEPYEGFAQCAAEMYAARIFNQQAGEPCETIYGAVTNAYDWVFLKLEGDTVFIDKNRYFLNDLPKILGIFQFIINQYKS